MAIIAQSARYGSGLYGTSEYGVVNLTASISGVSATGTIASVVAGGFEVDVTERISTGVSATGSINTLTVNIIEKLESVSATGTIGTLTLTGTANVTLVGVEAVSFLNTVEDKPTEILDSVSATGFVNDNFTFSNSHALTGIQGTTALGTIIKTAEVFNFQAVANQYSRARTIKIPRAA